MLLAAEPAALFRALRDWVLAYLASSDDGEARPYADEVAELLMDGSSLNTPEEWTGLNLGSITLAAAPTDAPQMPEGSLGSLATR